MFVHQLDKGCVYTRHSHHKLGVMIGEMNTHYIPQWKVTNERKWHITMRNYKYNSLAVNYLH